MIIDFKVTRLNTKLLVLGMGQIKLRGSLRGSVTIPEETNLRKWITKHGSALSSNHESHYSMACDLPSAVHGR